MPKRSLNQIVNLLDQRIQKASEFYLDRQPGWLGNYAGVVDVPNENGKVYVRLQSGQVVTAQNGVAPSIYNWAVYVGRDKSQPHILKVLETRFVHKDGDTPDYVKFHHAQHEFPGPDTVFVTRDQFMPLLVYPLGGMELQLYGDVVYSIGMSNPIRVPDTTINMTSYIPSSGARYVLIEIEPDGSLNYVTGTSEASREILLVAGDIPAPTNGNIPVCAVVTYMGQTTIRRDAEVKDIIDLRIFTTSTGDAHTHAFPNLDDLLDVDAPAPSPNQVLTWDDTAEEWIAADPTGTSTFIDDLTSQVPAASDHYDLAAEATSGQVLLFWNGVYQPPSEFTMDVDNLGLTTDFSPDADNTTSLFAIYGAGAFISAHDVNALHVNGTGEITGLPSATPVSGDKFVFEDASDGDAKKQVDYDVLANAWELIVDEDGTSLANWTPAGGTWSSDGTVIKQTDTTQNWRSLRYTDLVDVGVPLIYEAEIKIKTYASGQYHIGGLLVGYPGSVGAGGLSVDIRFNTNVESLQIDRFGLASILTITFDWGNVEEWHTLRIASNGGFVSAYVDGVLKGSAGNATSSTNDARYIGLSAYTAADFRNIKLWRLKLP